METRGRKSARLQQQAKSKLSSSKSSKKSVVGAGAANKSTKRRRGTTLITDENDVSTSEDEAQAKGPPAKGRAAGLEAMEEEEGNPTITNVRL